jgi:hypothetical protein
MKAAALVGEGEAGGALFGSFLSRRALLGDKSKAVMPRRASAATGIS